MERSSESALSFIQELAAVAQAMAALDLIVARLHCDWASFGSWSMLVNTGRAAMRKGAGPNAIWFGWDGKEGVLSIKTGSTKPQLSPSEWQTVLEQEFENSSAAREFATTYSRQFARQKDG